MITLLATATLVAQVLLGVVAVAAVLAALGRGSMLDAVGRFVGPDAVRLAWLVALVATVGSLYMSEVRHFQPCPLCWYQRVCMYPLVVVLGIAALTRDHRIGRYVLPLTVIGAATSVYHYQLERFPEQEAVACSRSVPCTTIWFEQFGYITIPMMALSAFALIGVLVWLAGRTHHGQGISDQA
jgi:disulfide bond formation protein DsbB